MPALFRESIETKTWEGWELAGGFFFLKELFLFLKCRPLPPLPPLFPPLPPLPPLLPLKSLTCPAIALLAGPAVTPAPVAPLPAADSVVPLKQKKRQVYRVF